MLNNYNLVIFDLDGTLIDSSEGIFNSIRYAEEKLNLDRLDDTLLPSFVGPPPTESYQKLHGLDQTNAKLATKYHREYAKEKGLYESKIYPGIRELLLELKNMDYFLSVATLKSQSIAEEILKNFEIYNIFDSIVGIDEDESLSKSQIINIAIDKIDSLEKSPVMIGDTVSDAIGAAKSNVDFIGVTYGFGFKSYQDLESTPYKGLVESVEGIQEILLSKRS